MQNATRLFLYAFLTTLLVFTGFACQKSSSQKSLISTTDTAIINGHKVVDGSKYQKHVVGIYDFQDDAICTGTLIEGNYVITAAHCLVNPANKMKVIFGLNLYELAAAREQDIVQATRRTITSYKVHPDYDEVANENKETDWNDIAILKFAGAIPEGYEPVQLLHDDSLLRRFAKITLVGFGVSEVETKDVKYSRSREFQEGLEYGEIICDENNESCLHISQSGDGPLRYTESEILGAQMTEFRLDESKTGTCSGDSGGPAFVTDKNGNFLLAGVTSRGSILCDDQGVYTSIPAFIPWLEKTAKQLR